MKHSEGWPSGRNSQASAVKLLLPALPRQILSVMFAGSSAITQVTCWKLPDSHAMPELGAVNNIMGPALTPLPPVIIFAAIVEAASARAETSAVKNFIVVIRMNLEREKV